MWVLWIVIGVVLIALFYASYSIRAGIYVKAFCSFKTAQRCVALTFDDGPDFVQTPKVLDLLQKYKVKATFFCIGEKSFKHRNIVERMVAEGHLLGNHSWSHSKNFPIFSRKRMKGELERTQELLENISGKPVLLFRPPFGVTNPTIATVVKQLQYKIIGWNIRSLDTCSKNVNEPFERIKKQVSPGAVILLHDRLPESDILLEMVLKYLEEQKYRVVRIDEMLES